MKCWPRPTRTIVISLASFVLLVTVLPSRLRLGPDPARRPPGDDDRHVVQRRVGRRVRRRHRNERLQLVLPRKLLLALSSLAGTVHGPVKVTGAPRGYPCVHRCRRLPRHGPPGEMCANPVYALSSNGSTRSRFASASGGSPASTGQRLWRRLPRLIRHRDDPSGGRVRLNLTVPYAAPAAINGTLTVRNVPENDELYRLDLLICPCVPRPPTVDRATLVSASHAVAGTKVQDRNVTRSYSLTVFTGPMEGLSRVLRGVGLHHQLDPRQGVTLVANQSSAVSLGTDFLQRDQALLTGTISVTGAPSGLLGRGRSARVRERDHELPGRLPDSRWCLRSGPQCRHVEHQGLLPGVAL